MKEGEEWGSVRGVHLGRQACGGGIKVSVPRIYHSEEVSCRRHSEVRVVEGRPLPWGKWEEQVWGASGLELIEEGTGPSAGGGPVPSDATRHQGDSELRRANDGQEGPPATPGLVLAEDLQRLAGDLQGGESRQTVSGSLTLNLGYI